MPLMTCELDGNPGWKFGSGGHCYSYKAGDESASLAAKKKAIAQGLAIGEGVIAKGEPKRGVMISLSMPEQVTKAMGKRQVPPHEMHVTLAYMGKAEAWQSGSIKKMVDVVKDVAAGFKPIEGRIGGYGRFKASKSSDGKDVIYASYSSPWLSDLRQEIVDGLRIAGVPPKPSDHGYIPHVTTDYVDPGSGEIAPPETPDEPFTVKGICINVGDVSIEIPFSGGEVENPEAPEPQELSDADVMALKMLGLNVVEKADKSPIHVPVRIISKDGAERLVYGVVLEPDMVDAQDQTMTAPDVEFAAHHFMAVQGITGYRHYKEADCQVLESYIAPCDFPLGEQVVKKGSWVLVTRVTNDEIWSQIESGEITGYSVGGFGILEPLAS